MKRLIKKTMLVLLASVALMVTGFVTGSDALGMLGLALPLIAPVLALLFGVARAITGTARKIADMPPTTGPDRYVEDVPGWAKALCPHATTYGQAMLCLHDDDSNLDW